MPSQEDIRSIVTRQIIEALERGGTPPWRRPWQLDANGGSPVNVQSKQPYRGINPLLLAIHADRYGLPSKWYGTFNQWKALGGAVKPRPSEVKGGEWGCHIVYYSSITKPAKGKDDDDEKTDRFFILRSYTVFSIDQVDGDHLDYLRTGQNDQPQTIDYEPAEMAFNAAINGMGVGLKHFGGRAFYSPSNDTIVLPPKGTFETPNEYYATAFHECVHATERPDRLDWSRKNRNNTYALGELIAELGGVFVCRELNVPASDDLSNHTAYLANWLAAMKNDTRFIFQASAQANKAASYLLGFSHKSDDATELNTMVECI